MLRLTVMHYFVLFFVIKSKSNILSFPVWKHHETYVGMNCFATHSILFCHVAPKKGQDCIMKKQRIFFQMINFWAALETLVSCSNIRQFCTLTVTVGKIKRIAAQLNCIQWNYFCYNCSTFFFFFTVSVSVGGKCLLSLLEMEFPHLESEF